MFTKIEKWQRDFFTIWGGQAISLITSAILQMAFIWYLTAQTGSAMVLSLASLVGFLPQAILGPVIGVFVDRYDRKLIMIGADLFIAAVSLVLVFVAVYAKLSIWMVMVVLFLRSVGTAFHSPSLNAITPLLVPESQLTRCAGYSHTVISASYIISPAIAAFLYSMWGLNVVIALDVLGAVIASITVVLVGIPKSNAPERAAEGNTVIREMLEGFNVIRRHKGLYALLWIGAFFALIYMPINALFPLMSMEYFGGSPAHASIVETAFAGGMLAGGLLLGVWGGFKKKAFTMSSSMLLMGMSLVISGLLPINGFPLFAVCSGLMGLSSPFYSGVQTALYQEKIKPEYLGRVFSLLGSLMSFMMPIGLIASGLFADQLGVNYWFFLSGVAIAVIGCLPIVIPSVRQL